jgi:type II secretory pathway component PulF
MAKKKDITLRDRRFTPFVYGVTDTGTKTLREKLHDFSVERTKVSFKEKSLFYKLFAVLITAGVTTLKSLKIMKNRTKNEKFFRIVSTIYDRVEKGGSLSQAFSEFPEVFSASEVGVISAGEAVGTLDSSFARLSEQMEREASVRQELKAALTYPLIIGVVLVIATIVMITFVIPEMRNLYLDNGLVIEGLTAVLLNGSEFIADNWLTIGASFVIVFLAFRIYFSSDNGAYYFDELLLKTPFISPIVKSYNLSMISRTMGTLVESGLPIQKSLRLIQQAVGNRLYKERLLELLGRVQTGEKISAVLAETPGLFPDTITQVLEIGETSANLGKLSLNIAGQYEEELAYKLKNVNTIIGPIVIVFVAVFVVLFALAILLPIFNLTQGVAL